MSKKQQKKLKRQNNKQTKNVSDRTKIGLFKCDITIRGTRL